MKYYQTLQTSDAQKGKSVTWEELLKRADSFVGGKIEASDYEGYQFRGAITIIKKNGKVVSIKPENVEQSVLDMDGDPTDEWEKCSVKDVNFDIGSSTTKLTEKENGAISIYSSIDPRFWTIVTIYPVG